MSIFGNRLRGLRKAANLTMNELADKICVSKSSINMYERGEREPSIDTLICMADYFNVTLDYLVGRCEKGK